MKVNNQILVNIEELIENGILELDFDFGIEIATENLSDFNEDFETEISVEDLKNYCIEKKYEVETKRINWASLTCKKIEPVTIRVDDVVLDVETIIPDKYLA